MLTLSGYPLLHVLYPDTTPQRPHVDKTCIHGGSLASTPDLIPHFTVWWLFCATYPGCVDSAVEDVRKSYHEPFLFREAFEKVVPFQLTYCRECDRQCLIFFLAACDQAALRTVQSVCLFWCLSGCLFVTTFFTMFPSSYHHKIFRSYYHRQKWYPCKRSRSEVEGKSHRGQNPI